MPSTAKLKPYKLYSLLDLLAMKSPRRRVFGPWRVNRRLRVITLPIRGIFYEIDLDRCKTCAQVMDWIFQVAGKTWADPDIIGWLVRALDEVLRPQETMCSNGKERTRGEKP